MNPLQNETFPGAELPPIPGDDVAHGESHEEGESCPFFPFLTNRKKIENFIALEL